MLENKNNSWLFLLPLIIMSVVAIALFLFLGINRSIWIDEACSIFVANHGIEDFLHCSKKIEASPPLYFFSLSMWVRLFGTSELAVRSLSGVFYMLSLAAIYVLGKAVYNDKKTGLLCSFLYMLSPLAIKHAQNARSYSLLGLMAILSTLFFLRLFLIKTNSRKDLALYVIVNILGTFTHYWFFFVISSQIACHILIFSRPLFKKFSVAILISVIPFLTLWLPSLLSHINRGISCAWIGKPGMHDLVFTLFDFCGGVSWKRAVPVYAVFLVLIVFKVSGFKIRFWGITNLKGFILQRQNLAFLTLLFVSLSIPFIISQVKAIYVPCRYTIIALPPFVMLVGSLLSRFGNKHIVLACCYILLIETAISFISYRATPKPFTDKSTTEYLIKHADNNDILIHTNLSQLPIDYYLRLMKPDMDFIKISFPSELELYPSWMDANKMLSQKDKLENEAESLVSRIDDIMTKNNDTKVWLLYGAHVEIGEILKKRLDSHFFLREAKDFNGSFHYVFDDAAYTFSTKEEKVLRRRPFYNYTFWDDTCTFYYSELYVYQIKPWFKDNFQW